MYKNIAHWHFHICLIVTNYCVLFIVSVCLRVYMLIQSSEYMYRIVHGIGIVPFDAPNSIVSINMEMAVCHVYR